MSESRWIYYDPNQGTQTLGLYHGQDSGNVVIYHNSHVVLIDFMVHQTKSYSFIVNQFLFKLDVQHTNGKYQYSFEAKQVEGPKEASFGVIKSLFKWPFSQPQA